MDMLLQKFSSLHSCRWRLQQFLHSFLSSCRSLLLSIGSVIETLALFSWACYADIHYYFSVQAKVTLVLFSWACYADIYHHFFQAGQKPHAQSTLILKAPVLSTKAAVQHRSSRLRKSQRPKLVMSEVACRVEGMPAADVLLPCNPARLTGLKAPTN